MNIYLSEQIRNINRYKKIKFIIIYFNKKFIAKWKKIKLLLLLLLLLLLILSIKWLSIHFRINFIFNTLKVGSYVF